MFELSNERVSLSTQRMRKMTNFEYINLLKPEEYKTMRRDYKTSVIEEKQMRRFLLGNNITLNFESDLTLKYHVQEISIVENLQYINQLQDELAHIYNQWPVNSDIKVTMFIGVIDDSKRSIFLSKYKTLCSKIYMKASCGKKIYAERKNNVDISCVEFLGFKTNGLIPEKVGVDYLDLNIEKELPLELVSKLQTEIIN
jgi:hypothetical protein